MATKYTDSALLAQGANPTGEQKTQDSHGRMRVLDGTYTAVATDDNTTRIFVGTLPVGARVLLGQIHADGGAATAISMNVGSLCASAKYGSLSFSASAAGFLANTSATNSLSPTAGVAGTLAAPEDVYMTPSATVSGTPTIGVALYYVVD